MKYQLVKGTKDVLPEDAPRWRLIEEKVRGVMTRYNYREIQTPIFEETDLFARSIGPYTDIVGKEMYTFQVRGGKSLTLKPEMTAPVVRAYLQHHLGERAGLVKLYYLSPMFRQDRPQAGRFRQFHQFGAEAIGSADPRIDVETILVALRIYQELGLKNTALLLNSVGCPRCRRPYEEELRAFLVGRLKGLCPDCRARYRKNPIRVLDCKREGCLSLLAGAPMILDHLCDECREHFGEVQHLLKALNISFEVNKQLVRGLDYYTKTAYEVISAELGAQDSLGGGGRYDLLVSDLGGKATPAVGFAAGMERLILVMEKQGLFAGDKPGTVLFIAALGPEAQSRALKLAETLRGEGVPCELDYLDRSLKAQLREANRQGAKLVVIIGEEELKSNEAIIKDMKGGSQEKVPLEGINAYIKQKIKTGLQ